MIMNRLYKILVLPFVLSIFLGCSVTDDPYGDNELLNPVKHVVFIGLDGWGGHNFEISKMQHLSSLLEEGVWTLEKKAVLPSGSGQNWCSMFMGVSPDIHGYTEWDSTTPSYTYGFEIKNNIFPTIFQVLKEKEPDSEIGVFFQWEGIKYFVDTLSVDHVSHIPLEKGHEFMTDSVKTYVSTKKPTLCAIIYDDPDHTGHQSGYFTEEYYMILQKLDCYISEIVQAVKTSGYYDETVFIITSDHGGLGYSHSGDTPEEINTPFIMFGRNVKSLGRVNTSVVQYDVAPMIANVLGLEEPELWIGNNHQEFFENNK